VKLDPLFPEETPEAVLAPTAATWKAAWPRVTPAGIPCPARITATLSPTFPAWILVDEPEVNEDVVDPVDEPEVNLEPADPADEPEVKPEPDNPADEPEVKPEPANPTDEPEVKPADPDEPEVKLEPDDPELTADDPVDVVPVDPAMKLDLIAFPEETPEAVFTPATWKAA